MRRVARHAVSLIVVLLLAACGQGRDGTAGSAASASSGPDDAIRKTAALLKAGDFAGLFEHSLPPADFAKLKGEWREHTDDAEVTAEDRQHFVETMGKLTAPDAEDKLYAELQPQLAAFDAEFKKQGPMYIGMGRGWLQGMVAQSQTLSEQEKAQANTAIDALAQWAQNAKFTDPALARQAIGIACKAARAVGLKTLDEARALDFDQSMHKAQVVFGGVKELLALYGLSIDQTLDSIKPEVVSNDGKTARVKVAYTLLGAPLSAEGEMINVDGRWYGKEAIEKLRETDAEQTAPAAPAAPETAAGGSH
jgi:hypothetical protein